MRETQTAVYFWGGPLSQWFRAPFLQRLRAESPPLRWNCAEQFMMGAKAALFGDVAALEAIRRETDPKVQKAIGRRVKPFDPAIWDAAIDEILVRGNLGKFHAHRDLRSYLLSTSGKRLVEGSPVDRIYGVGLHYTDPRIDDPTNWRGLNRLGNALETVRAKLADRAAQENP